VEQLFGTKKLKSVRSDPSSRHTQKSNDNPSALVHPFSQSRDAIRRRSKRPSQVRKISMHVKEFAAWRIFFHLDMQDHSVEYRNTEQLRYNYSLAQSPEE
jgi:hypothetical protein